MSSAMGLYDNDADEARRLTKEIAPPDNFVLSRFQTDVSNQIRQLVQKVDTPCEVSVQIEVTSRTQSEEREETEVDDGGP